MGRRVRIGRHGSCAAACAEGSCTPATPILSWRAGWYARTAWAAMPGGILPTGFGGWDMEKGRIIRKRYDIVRAITGI